MAAVVMFVERWARMSYWRDFKPFPEMTEKMVHWMSTIEGINELKRIFIERDEVREPMPDVATLPVPSTSGITMNHKFLDWDKSLIAEHLTLIETDMYNKVQPQEFSNMAWQRDNKEELAPNLVRMAERFNSLSFWVAASIVFGPLPPRTMQHVLYKWINVAWALKRMRNFQTMMAVVAGLNHGAVQRMKAQWGSLGPKYQERYTALEALFSPLQGYKNYRDAVGATKASVATVPYLPPVLGDLAMQQVGNPALIDERINVDAIRLLGARIHDALKFQPATYRFSSQDPSVIIYFMSTALESITEDDIYVESQRREPFLAKKPTTPARQLRRSSFALASPGSPSAYRKGSAGGEDPLHNSGSSNSISRVFSKVRQRRGSVFMTPQASPPMPPGPLLPADRQAPPMGNLSSPLLRVSSSPSTSSSVAPPSPSSSSSPPPVSSTPSSSPSKRPASVYFGEAPEGLMPLPIQRGAKLDVNSVEEAKQSILTMSRDHGERGVVVKTTRMDRSGSWPPPYETWKPFSMEAPSKAELLREWTVCKGDGNSSGGDSSCKGKEELSDSQDSVSSSSGGTPVASPKRPSIVRPLFPLPPVESSPQSAPEGILTVRATPEQVAEARALSQSKPKLENWTVDNVATWLQSTGLGGYVGAFAENDVGGADLIDLTKDDLVDLGVIKIGHKKLLLSGIQDLVRKQAAALRSPQPPMAYLPPGPRTPRVPNNGGASPIALSPRLMPIRSPRVASGSTSPRSGAVSPRGLVSPRSMTSLFVKIKCDGKVAGVLEVNRNLNFEELVAKVAHRLNGPTVNSLHYVDADGEFILIKGESELRLLIDQNVSSNFSVVANHKRKKKKQGSRRLIKTHSTVGGV